MLDSNAFNYLNNRKFECLFSFLESRTFMTNFPINGIIKQTKIMFHISKFTLSDRLYPIESTNIRSEGTLWTRQILWAVKVRAT